MKVSKLEMKDSAGNSEFYTDLNPQEAVGTILAYLPTDEITGILKAVFNQHLPDDRRTEILNGIKP